MSPPPPPHPTPPPRRNNEKTKDAGASEASIIIAPFVERLEVKAVEKSKRVREDIQRLKEDIEAFIDAKKKDKEIRKKRDSPGRTSHQRSRRTSPHQRISKGVRKKDGRRK